MKVINLGCGTPGTRSWHPIEGADNLDASMGWRFEDGLHQYVDRSVDGITISHALMYVAAVDWPFVFSEFARVLRDGGVVRITEDETLDTRSARLGGWKGSAPAVTLTHPLMVKAALEAAGLVAFDVDPGRSYFGDMTLIQQQHGDPPHVFFCEGVRMNRVLFSPHSDDETLFAAFTILRYRPRVVVCFPSSGDYGPTSTRFAETVDAMSVLGGGPCDQWLGGDLVAQMRELDERIKPSLVFAPASGASHPDHVAVAQAAAAVFGDRLRCFHTYDADGKVRAGHEAEFEPVWVWQKLRALARYETQITHPRAHAFFLEDLREYLDE